jgi:hypothetical protein
MRPRHGALRSLSTRRTRSIGPLLAVAAVGRPHSSPARASSRVTGVRRFSLMDEPDDAIGLAALRLEPGARPGACVVERAGERHRGYSKPAPDAADGSSPAGPFDAVHAVSRGAVAGTVRQLLLARLTSPPVMRQYSSFPVRADKARRGRPLATVGAGCCTLCAPPSHRALARSRCIWPAARDGDGPVGAARTWRAAARPCAPPARSRRGVVGGVAARPRARYPARHAALSAQRNGGSVLDRAA